MIARMLSADEALLRRIGAFRPAGATRAMKALTHLGDAPSWVTIGLFLVFGGAPRAGCLLGAGALLATMASQLLKRSCCRPRPSPAKAGSHALIEVPDAFSFPSGHPAAAFAVAVAVAGQGGLGPLAFGLAAAVGLSRVYLGAHYPLDVAAGALLGCGCGALARLLIGV